MDPRIFAEAVGIPAERAQSMALPGAVALGWEIVVDPTGEESLAYKAYSETPGTLYVGISAEQLEALKIFNGVTGETNLSQIDVFAEIIKPERPIATVEGLALAYTRIGMQPPLRQRFRNHR